MPVESVPTPSAPPAAGPYSPAVRAGDWLVLAGPGRSRSRDAARMVAGGVEAQARQVLANIAAVLGDCGAQLTDVAKTTVFVTDIAQFATVNAVYAEAFGDHRPARSTVQVAALPGGAEVEIEVWAYVAALSRGSFSSRDRRRARPARDLHRRADRPVRRRRRRGRRSPAGCSPRTPTRQRADKPS